MRLLKNAILVATLCLAITSCGSSDDPAEEATSDATTPTETAAAPAEPEPEPIPLPEGFPEAASIFPGLEITAAQVLDAEKVMYSVTGASRETFDAVLEYYEKYFADGDWAEDMIMTQPDQAIISFSKDGLLVAVEAVEGGLGCYVTVTTGAI